MFRTASACRRSAFLGSRRRSAIVSQRRKYLENLLRSNVSYYLAPGLASALPHPPPSPNALLDAGTVKLESGDITGAKELYEQSVRMKKTPGGLFNLGVAWFHLKEYDKAIEAWKDNIEMQPESADAHTNLASAYVVSPISRPDLALHQLHVAASLEPEDAEIAFNLAAVLEACGKLEEALEQYKLSKQLGVEKADMHIRNVSAKILGKRMKEAEAREQDVDDSPPVNASKS